MFNPFSIITKPIGCLFSLIGSLLVFAFIVLLAAWFGFGLIFTPKIEDSLSSSLGLPVEIEGSSLRPFSCTLAIDGLAIANPEGFPEELVMLKVDEVTLQSTWKAVYEEDPIPIDEAVIDISRINFHTNNSGLRNMDAFGSALAAELTAMEQPSVWNLIGLKFDLKKLTVRIGKVDQGKIVGSEVQSRMKILNYERTFTTVDSMKAVVSAIASDMRGQGLGELARALEQSARSIGGERQPDAIDQIYDIIRSR